MEEETIIQKWEEKSRIWIILRLDNLAHLCKDENDKLSVGLVELFSVDVSAKILRDCYASGRKSRV